MDKALEDKLQQILDAISSSNELIKLVRENQLTDQKISGDNKAADQVKLDQIGTLLEEVAAVAERLEATVGKPIETDLLHPARVGTQEFEDELKRCRQVLQDKKHPEYEAVSERMRLFGRDR